MQSAPGFVPGFSVTAPMAMPPKKTPTLLNQLYGREEEVQVSEVREFQLRQLRCSEGARSRENIEKVDFGPYRHLRREIIASTRAINDELKQDYTKEKQELAENLANAVASRSMELVQSGFIRPVASPIIDIGASRLVTHFRSLSHLPSPGLMAVAGGDSVDEDEKEKKVRKPKEQPHSDHPAKLLSYSDGKEADRLIVRTGEVFSEEYKKSLEETKRHRTEVSSAKLFKDRDKEIAQNVAAIHKGQGNIVFNSFAEFNEVTGGALRYLFDQTAHTMHIVDPGSMALVNATVGTVVRGVGSLYIKLPPAARSYVENAYRSAMGEFPTENQKFFVQLTAGPVLGEFTTSGVSLALKRLPPIFPSPTNISGVVPFLGRGKQPLLLERTGCTGVSALTTQTVTEAVYSTVEGTSQAVHSLHKASSANAQTALSQKLSALVDAQKKAVKVEALPDGRIRYYGKERPSITQGPTRGASYVTEHNPNTGQVRSWLESYDHTGNITRVHPKMLDGQDLKGQHYPLTGKELK